MVDHNHHQCDCNHFLKICNHCDVVYCTKCKKEWKSYFASSWQWKWMSPQYQTYTNTPVMTSAASNTLETHSHD